MSGRDLHLGPGPGAVGQRGPELFKFLDRDSDPTPPYLNALSKKRYFEGQRGVCRVGRHSVRSQSGRSEAGMTPPSSSTGRQKMMGSQMKEVEMKGEVGGRGGSVVAQRRDTGISHRQLESHPGQSHPG